MSVPAISLCEELVLGFVWLVGCCFFVFVFLRVLKASVESNATS